MNQTAQLYVNDQLIDLQSGDREPIQYVLQANDLGDITSVEANYTKQFTIPLTAHNKAILGYPGEVFLMASKNPYDYYPAKLVYAGIELIPKGKLLVIRINNDTADVTIISGNADFMDLLSFSLYDMGDSLSPASGYGTKLVWKKWDIPVWDVPTVATSQKNTEGWIWPVVQYGNVDTNFPFSNAINVRNMRPAFFLKTALELLVESTGYTIDKPNSCLYANPKYYNLFSKMLVPNCNSDFEHGTDYQNTPATNAMLNNYLTTQLVFTPSAVHQGFVPFNQLNYGPVTQNVDGTAEVIFDIYVKGRATGSNPTRVFVSINVLQTLTGDTAVLAETSFDLSQFRSSHEAGQISGDGGDIIAWQWFRNNKLTIDCQLVPGMEISVGFGVTDSLETYFAIPIGASFSFLPSEQNVLFGQSIQCERIFPDMSQIDLLKFILRTFALMPIADPNKGTVRFISFAQVIANKPNARDWSGNVLDMGKQVAFNLGNNYAQVNRLRHAFDDSIPLNYMPKYFADDNIPIADKTLNPLAPVQDLYASPFSPSINTPYFGGTIAQISSPTSTDEFSVGNEPRILIDEKLNLLAVSIEETGQNASVNFADADQGFYTVNQIINDLISTPYFFKNDAPDLSPAARHLCWCDKGGFAGLKSTYYPEFQHILQNTKKVNRFFMLSPLDIKDFDFSIPVYVQQDGAYYYVNKIDSWSYGNPCKVELIRL